MRNAINAVSDLIKKYSFLFDADQKRNAVLLAFVLMLASLFELLGVGAVMPFVQAIIKGDRLFEEPWAASLAEMSGTNDISGMVFLIGALIVVIYLIKNLYLMLSYYLKYSFTSHFKKSVSDTIVKLYLSTPYEIGINFNSAEIIRLCTTDLENVRWSITDLFSIIGEVFTVVVIGIFVVYTDPFIAIGMIAIMFCILIAIVTFFKPITKKHGQLDIASATEKNKCVNEIVSGLKEIRIMNRGQNFIDRFCRASETQKKAQTVYYCLGDIPDRLVEAASIGGIILVVSIKMLYSGVDAETLLPRLGAFAVAAFRLMPSVGKITGRINSIIYHRAALNAVYEGVKVLKKDANLQLQNDYSSLREENEHIGNNARNFSDSLKFNDELKIQDIEFSYIGSHRKILQGVNISIKQGESVALIGESGAGKTTVSDVILGLLRPQKGNVLLDGIDISYFPEEWSKLIGYVPQTIFLLDNTIRENVLFGGDYKDDAPIWEALEQAQVASFVRTLPEGLDTIVGERGVKLSGGQRQRIVIARALYHKPQLLVLDEATAALDSETEAAVMESIEALQGNITMLIVAHRLSTIQNCDKVYEIKDGGAVERDDVITWR